LEEADITGPLFISIGDDEKLSRFLELNPRIPRQNALVDGYDFKAYNSAGLGKIGDDRAAAKDVKLKPPTGVNWWSYLTNVGRISPVPKDLPFGKIPEGVLRLGATFAVNCERIEYAWADRLPGDHPEIGDVIDSFKVEN